MSRVNGYTQREPRLGVCSANERDSKDYGKLNICFSRSRSFIFSFPAFFEGAASSHCWRCSVLSNSLRTAVTNCLALSLATMTLRSNRGGCQVAVDVLRV